MLCDTYIAYLVVLAVDLLTCLYQKGKQVSGIVAGRKQNKFFMNSNDSGNRKDYVA